MLIDISIQSVNLKIEAIKHENKIKYGILFQ